VSARGKKDVKRNSENKMMKQPLRGFILWIVIVVAMQEGGDGGLDVVIAKTFTMPWSALDFTTPSNTTFTVGDQLSELR
jgi:hypothetical protein